MKSEITFPEGSLWQPQLSTNRWPEVRSWNVNHIKNLWQDEPNRVQVINDPRLGTSTLVMMRKDHFEHMNNLLRDLFDGQAGIESDLNVALEHVSVIENTIIPAGDQESMRRAISVLKVLVRNSKRVYAAEPKAISPAPLTADELAAVEQDDEL